MRLPIRTGIPLALLSAAAAICSGQPARVDTLEQAYVAQRHADLSEAAQRTAGDATRELQTLEASATDRGLVLTLGDVLFDAGQSSLKAGALTAIDRLVQFMGDYPERSVRIEGHTDSAGSDAANLELSERRALAVRAALLERGIDAARAQAVGYGETRPIASNDTPGGRQQNRRIDIVVSDEQGAFGDEVRHLGVE